MAFPVVESTSQGVTAAGGGTLTLPTGITAGDLILVLTNTGAAATPATPTGYTLIGRDNTERLFYHHHAAYYRVATGSDACVFSGVAGDFGPTEVGYIVYRISSAGTPTGTFTGAYSAPSHTTTNGDNLWIVSGAEDFSTSSGVLLANYSNLIKANNSPWHSICSMRRERTAETETPPSTEFVTAQNSTSTIAVPYAAPPSTVEVITTTGARTWTVPAGVSEVFVECWGGGSPGKYAPDNFNKYGGGGGAYAAKTVAVTAGASISYSVGDDGPLIPGQDSVAGDTWFLSTSEVLAKGGFNSTGGSAATSVGTTKYSGGNGVASNNGAGGASASPSGAGGHGSGTTGGSSPNAGAGGVSPGAQQDDDGDSHPDGGGGGSGYGGGGGSPGGGGGGDNGGNGQIRLTYYVTSGGGTPAPTRKAPRHSFLQ